MSVAVYGIKNCSTMKKAMTWLETHGVAFTFHDYKKEGVDDAVLARAIAEKGWENVVNRRGTTWRKLPEETRDGMDAARALAAVRENPSLIKRPLLVSDDGIRLGFDEAVYAEVAERSRR